MAIETTVTIKETVKLTLFSAQIRPNPDESVMNLSYSLITEKNGVATDGLLETIQISGKQAMLADPRFYEVVTKIADFYNPAKA